MLLKIIFPSAYAREFSWESLLQLVMPKINTKNVINFKKKFIKYFFLKVQKKLLQMTEAVFL